MDLIVGTDSTWSLRVWICLQLVKIDASEKVIDLNLPDYKSKILKYSPTGLVPALVDGSIVIHDSLAITEYINECTHGKLYPAIPEQRAVARSLCAEMHSGFMNLRNECPFTLQTTSGIADFNESIKAEILRIEAIFIKAKLPYMFEAASAVDAFYSILAFRLNSYGITLQGKAGEYQNCLLNWPLLQNAIAQAKQWKCYNR